MNLYEIRASVKYVVRCGTYCSNGGEVKRCQVSAVEESRLTGGSERGNRGGFWEAQGAYPRANKAISEQSRGNIA